MNKLETFLESYNDFNDFIKEIIKYTGDLDSSIEKWNNTFTITDDSLELYENDDEYDVDFYVISSHATKGDKIYMGEYQNYIVLMAYPDSGDWRDTTIFILDKSKQI